MQRKPGFPVTNCGIKMPDSITMIEPTSSEDDIEQRRLQLINFGHSQWGFNNWSWSVTKQEIDFVDFTNGKYYAGVVAFVNVTVKSFDIHRENIGYATSVANTKGFAVYKSRKFAITNALRETLLSFGGSVATELAEMLEAQRAEYSAPANVQADLAADTNQNAHNRQAEPKNSPHSRPARRDSADAPPAALRSPHAAAAPPAPPAQPAPPAPPAPPGPPPAVKNAGAAKPLPLGPLAHGPPANRPLGGAVRPGPAPAPPRPNSNEPAKSAAELAEEEARAERKRRQRLAQEEFRQKQLMKQNTDDKQELGRNSSSFDKLLLDIPTQDIVIEATGDDSVKRKSPGQEGGVPKRRTGSFSKLDIVKDD